jgi:NAD(P)-dependent dehydrogenase (short-subunit alcohol dehydrogenase family)
MAPSFSHSLDGKRVLVTGGGRGIGEAIVRKFYNDDAIVFVIDKDQSLLTKLKNELPNIHPIYVDLLNWKATQEAVLGITPLDHLVNNAGVFAGDCILQVTEEDLDLVMGVNFKAIVCLTQAFVNGNIKAGKEKGTTVVNISSVADRVAMWGAAAYCSSKAAVTSLTKTMALEFGDMNIRVNAICPTAIQTEMVKNMKPHLFEKNTPLVEHILLKHKPLETSDIADSVLFLSSPLSQMVTGTSLLVDSGTRAF